MSLSHKYLSPQFVVLELIMVCKQRDQGYQGPFCRVDTWIWRIVYKRPMDDALMIKKKLISQGGMSRIC